ncbi:MAG: hypothetical protein KJ971_04595 [Firmicutes bacterium]|nr:hypothetical protein [Bacillota bacterium]
MIRECPQCGRPVLHCSSNEIDGDMYLYPIFDCLCKIDYKKYGEKIKKDYTKCRMDQFFINNDFKVHNKELKKYYDNLEWVEEGISLLIFGNPGTQKTGQITAIMKKVYIRYSSLYYRTTELPYQRNMEEIKNVVFLVLDNFGKSDFENSRGAVFDLIDYRIHNYLSTVLITNMTGKDIAQIYDMAFADRMKMFKKISILGESKRGK